MFDLCIFDLDETLLYSNDLEKIRKLLVNNEDEEVLEVLIDALNEDPERYIYSQDLLLEIRNNNPDLKLAVFTRSPSSYTESVLEWAYPDITWDGVICYEDVNRTKPHGEGICDLMERFDIDDPYKVVMVGDSSVDIQSAYNAGCYAVLDKSGWPREYEYTHWNSLKLIPDAIINEPETLLRVLSEPDTFLPSLECLLESGENTCRYFDKINHFIPREIGGNNHAYPIYVAGRNFADYRSLQVKRSYSLLTESIENNKNARSFPNEWIVSIFNFIKSQNLVKIVDLWRGINTKVVITSVPPRPGRIHRLSYLLNQLDDYIVANPIHGLDVITMPNLLGYSDGVRSQHNEHLSFIERFENVRDHIYISEPERLVDVDVVILIDDVVTTGASLIYSSIKLKDSNDSSVICFAFAKNITDVLDS
ncbi:HAD hydrolase-like protein [Proteus terrae]|uniref:HAD hydrolase-like protein n=1 Tax=Proteus terrae TaxID=1574161 RepID=UPI001C600E01|nr:HAD hydrolase-like protein [Proteus terrae]